MKKTVLIVLAVVLCVAIAAGGTAAMYFSPRGPLNPSDPDTAVQNCIDSGEYVWKDEFIRLYTIPTTEFEDSTALTDELYDRLAGSGGFTFREYKGVSTAADPVYILTGVSDLLTVEVEYRDSMWQVSGLSVPEGLFSVPSRTVSVTVPSDAGVFINGIEVAESYIVSDFVGYEDMVALEQRFETVPHRVRYEIPGIYGNVEVSVQRENGTVLQSSDGTDWSYTVPDAAAYNFRVTAPSGAIVTVNGAQLDAAEKTADIPYEPLITVPEELVERLPNYVLYEAKGLYSVPVISAADENGNAMTAEEAADGSVSFRAGGSDALYEEHHALVEEFIENVLEYGAGHTTRAFPADFTIAESELYYYFRNAISSLYWVAGVSVDYDELTAYDFVPLGEDGFICRANAKGTTKTSYQTVDFDLEYEMLWVNKGGVWKVADMAFTDHFERTKIR